MSTKRVRSLRIHLKFWTAAIVGSMTVLHCQTAWASQHEMRGSHRADNGFDRRAAKQMYKAAIPGFQQNDGGNANARPNLSFRNDNRRENILEKRLQRHSPNWSFQNTIGQVAETSQHINLDLSSQAASITLGQKLFARTDSVEIKVGDSVKTVSAGSNVTAAEYVAVKQVLAGGSQKIIVSSAGSAEGGRVDLSALTEKNGIFRASDLVVPESVTAYGDLSKGSDFKLFGDLNNFGNIQLSSQGNNSKRAANIHADDILNAQGANIVSKNDLNLNADRQFINDGTVSSDGNLSITAGTTLVNRGLLSSKNGSVTLDSPAELNVVNTGGSIEALSSSINIRNDNYSGEYNTNIVGGDLLSKEVNVFTGNGTANIDVKQLTGKLNSVGTGVHVRSETDNLIIGTQKLDGDPTYYNIGEITIDGNISVGEKLTILASNNIIGTANVTQIIARTAGGVGQDITIISGADLTPSGGALATGNVPSGSPIAAGETVRVTGRSPTGGYISFEASPSLLISAAGTGSNHAGGNVNLIAYRTCP